MKKVIVIISIGLITLSLSGCKTKTAPTPADGGVFKSYNFGESWEQKVFIKKTDKGTQTISNLSVQFIEFDPIVKDTVYVMGATGALYKSENGADSWQKTALPSGKYTNLSIDTLNNKVLYTASSKAILKSVDGGATWHNIYTESHSGEALSSVIVDPFHSNIVYASSTSSIIKSTDYGITWKLTSWEKPTIYKLFHSYKNENVIFAHASTGLYISTDGAESWASLTENFKEDYGFRFKALWLSFDPKTEYFLMGTSSEIMRSFDSGSSWETVPTLFDYKKIAIKTVTQNPGNFQEVMFAIKTFFQKTDDGGQTWKVLKTVPTTKTITFIAADPFNADVVYVSTKEPAAKKK
ncbi:MAG: hypothetical protein PHY34_01725 [Patescibacteria group bacterium]|nr:hypothetical protein [Patescibacteria group bacterium]